MNWDEVSSVSAINHVGCVCDHDTCDFSRASAARRFFFQRGGSLPGLGSRTIGWSMSYFRRPGHATAAGDAIAFAVARADATKRRSASKPIAGLSLAIPVPSILDGAAHGAMTPGPRPERLAVPAAARRCVVAYARACVRSGASLI